LAGTYAASTNVAADILAGDTALSLGNPISVGNLIASPPQFRMYGVAPNQTLVSYDLLDLDASAAIAPIAENVIEMRAIYGVDTNDDNVLDAWVNPTGIWSGATLRDGSPGSSARIRQIVAIRLALVMRSSLLERDPVAASTTFVLYGDLPGGSPTRTLNYVGGDAARYRYRVIESTIPLRNNLL
jgi:type IV pilus assembly protein PilW